MKKILIILLMLFFTVSLHAQPEGDGAAFAKKPVSKKAVYYCPMHPSYTSEKPGDCPICNMKLVKKPASPAGREEAQGIEKEAAAIEDAQEGFYVSLEKQQLIGVKTDKVIYRPLSKIIRTVGRVAFDPELYKAQAEYIEAIKAQENVKESTEDGVINRAKSFVEASELKLKLQGLDIKQIKELGQSRKNDQSLLISSTESDYSWVYATIYEYELELVKLGQEALINAVAYPAKEFKGKIVAIDPVFNAMTRSVRARIKVENAGGLLKPDMYVDVRMQSDLGTHLAVPIEAIMDSGLRKIVFLVSAAGYFKSVEVKTGVSTDEYTQVFDGLKEGDTVVISGNFLIDSESKLKSALEGIGHQH